MGVTNGELGCWGVGFGLVGCEIEVLGRTLSVRCGSKRCATLTLTVGDVNLHVFTCGT